MANYLTTDTDLTAVADAIRAKGGTNDPLSFPQGFVDAVGAIETGGGGLEEKLATGIYSGGVLEFPYSVVGRCFSNTTGAFVLKMPNVLKIEKAFQFEGCTATSIFMPQCVLKQKSIFAACSSLNNIVYHHSESWVDFMNCGNLKKVDILSSEGFLDNSFSSGCTNLDTLVLRGSSVVPLKNITALGSTKFKNGGAGGTIYIPKALYDHLSDGTSLDYKAATNWSTIDGYGTITWAQIEGSIYETQYADGTPITT